MFQQLADAANAKAAASRALEPENTTPTVIDKKKGKKKKKKDPLRYPRDFDDKDLITPIHNSRTDMDGIRGVLQLGPTVPADVPIMERLPGAPRPEVGLRRTLTEAVATSSDEDDSPLSTVSVKSPDPGRAHSPLID